MKILYIIPQITKRAGAEVFSVSLVEELLKNKDNELMMVVYYDGVDPSFKNLVNRLDNRIVFLHKKPGLDFKASHALSKVIRAFKPDVIHTNLFALLTLFLASRHRNTPIVHTVHSIAKSETTKADTFIRKRLLRSHRLTFVGISNEITKSIEQYYGLNQVETIYNGIKLQNPDFAEGFSNKDGSFTFIAVARFSPEKNLGLLVDAFDRISARHEDVRLLICGDGLQFEEIRQKIENMDKGNRITLFGAVPDVGPYLSQADCFVLSSIYEGNPISILEAMNYKLPIVAPVIGGIPDIVTDGKEGLLYKVSDEDALVDAMERAVSDPKAMALMGEAGFNKVQRFSIAETAKQYLGLYHKVANIQLKGE